MWIQPGRQSGSACEERERKTETGMVGVSNGINHKRDARR